MKKVRSEACSADGVWIAISRYMRFTSHGQEGNGMPSSSGGMSPGGKSWSAIRRRRRERRQLPIPPLHLLHPSPLRH